jgi:MFS family permease
MNTASSSLLRRNVPFRTLVASRLISSAGTWIAYVALTVDIYARTHSSVWVSGVLLADFLPTILVASLAGSLLDRLPRRTLLVAAELGAALVFGLLPFAPSAAAVVVLALLAGLASAVYYPTVRAVVPSLVDEADLPRANALSQTVANAGLAVGPALAGVLVAASGVGSAYALNAASFVISAALLARVRTTKRPATEQAATGKGHWHDVLDGLRAFTDTPALRMVMRVWLLASVGGAAISVGEVFLARDVLHAGTFGFGLLASGSGAGLVAGSLLAPRLLTGSPARACRIGLAVAAAGFAAAALAPNIWCAAAFVLVGGVGNAVLVSAATLLVQREAGEARLGRAFAAFDGAASLATCIGMSGAGLAVAALGARGAWIAAAGLLAVAALTSLPRRHAVRARLAEPGLSS